MAKTPKWPRLQVSGERHNKLAEEAKKKGTSITKLVEDKFVQLEEIETSQKEL